MSGASHSVADGSAVRRHRGGVVFSTKNEEGIDSGDQLVLDFMNKRAINGLAIPAGSTALKYNEHEARVRHVQVLAPDTKRPRLLPLVIAASYVLMCIIAILAFLEMYRIITMNIQTYLIVGTVLFIVEIFLGGFLARAFWSANPSMYTDHKITAIISVWIPVFLLFPFLGLQVVLDGSSSIDWKDHNKAFGAMMAMVLIIIVFLLFTLVVGRSMYTILYPTESVEDLMAIPANSDQMRLAVDPNATGSSRFAK